MQVKCGAFVVDPLVDDVAVVVNDVGGAVDVDGGTVLVVGVVVPIGVVVCFVVGFPTS